jgi:hypothetical protein
MEIIEDNLHPKVLKNRLFITAVDYLIDQKVVEDQKGVSVRTGITAAALSNIRNDKKIVSDKTIRKFLEGFPGIFNPAYFKGENIYMTLNEAVEAKMDAEEQKRKVSEQLTPQPQVPDYIQKLIEESVRMSTRNELLERQCENLIAELRQAKTDNDTFIEELKKSKEFNDTLAAELKISREQNETLITQLRETRKENTELTAKLTAAIDGIESMKNQMAMMIGQYAAPQSPAFPMSVNDEGDIKFVIPDVLGHDAKSKKKMKEQLYAIVPQGLIRGGRPGVSEEIIKQALEAFLKEK